MTKIPKVQYRGKDEKIGFEMFPLENLVNIDIPTDHNPFQRKPPTNLIFSTSGDFGMWGIWGSSGAYGTVVN